MRCPRFTQQVEITPWKVPVQINWRASWRDNTQLEHIDRLLITVSVCTSDSIHKVCFDARRAAARSTSRNYSRRAYCPCEVRVRRRCGNKIWQKPIYQTPLQRPIGWLEAGANMTQSLSWMPAAKLLYSSKRMCMCVCVCVCLCVPVSVCVSVWSCAVKCTDGWLIHQSCDSSITAVTIPPSPPPPPLPPPPFS